MCIRDRIDTAHGMGIAVIMDIVHSHAVKNEVEGLGNFAGDPNQYFYPGGRREHPAWDSLCFDLARMKSFTSCCLTVNTGWKNINSMDSVLTV